MSRNRTLIVAAVLAVFFVVAGALVASSRQAGKSITIDVTVTGANTMSPKGWKANQNDTVTVNLKSDTDGEVHLHVYDKSFETKAGKTVSLTFKADKSGNFPIEWESTKTELGQLVVSP
jgi:copper(I)-binding protein